jgi:hypothetical protein
MPATGELTALDDMMRITRQDDSPDLGHDDPPCMLSYFCLSGERVLYGVRKINLSRFFRLRAQVHG